MAVHDERDKQVSQNEVAGKEEPESIPLSWKKPARQRPKR